MRRIFVFCLSLASMLPANAGFSARKKSRGSVTPQKQLESKSGRENSSSISPSPSGSSGAIVESDASAPEKSQSNEAPPVERIFRNPVLNSGLSNGADAINRSINSLMESLFYNLMDNDIQHKLTGSAGIGLTLKRDVLQAENGAYVVIDRFGMGPFYGKELYRFNEVPVNLGASQSNDVYDIYLRTDPMRVNETAKLPFWRVAVNNWFGILPILETVLPPSFNANELYDPLRRIEAPFTFPMSKEAFEAMETGSIKSYAISGGINLGVETTEGMHGFKDIVTAGKSGAELKLPYTIFRSGEYRVSVLKRDLNTAWVGITDTNRTGHRIESKVGKTYFLLSETIPYWKGLAAPIFPLDFSIEEAVSDLFGRVYSFDFRNTEAQSAYLEAVHGNLAAGQLSWLRHREDKLDTGVSFFYTKKEKRFETSIGAGLSLFVINKGSKRIHSDAEIEIVDPQGRFYILEARQNKDQKLWDILTGSSTSNYSAVTDLRVRKVIEGTPADPDKFRYDFVADLNPIETVLTLQTIDKFVETEDFQKYLTTIGSFTGIDLLGELPGIPIRDEEKLEQRRRTTAFETDLKKPLNLHTTPTHLGSFEGYASVHIRTTDLNRIADQPKDAMWGAFCRGFNISRNRCGIWQESAFSRDLDRAGGVMATPLNLFDIFLSRLDALSEIEDAIDALQMFKRDADPTKKRDHLRRLLSTAYPLALAHALMELAGPENISRNVQLGTTPKGNGSEAAKSLFKAVNGRRFHRGPKDPEAARYDSTLDTESKFNPANVTFAGARPHIKRLALFREDEDPISGDTNLTAVPRLSVRLYATRLEDAPDIRIYVRVEQTGKVQLAKFKLAEQVFEVPIAEAGFDFEAGTSNYLLRLTGPKAVIQSMILSEAISLGGTFRATFAVSTNGITWSDESHLDFRIDNGLLLPGD